MKILKYKSFLEKYEEPEGQGGPEEAQAEPDFRKIGVPGTNWNLEEFEKKLGTPITYYELSEDGKQVTEINGRPIADVLKQEFPENEEDIEQWVYLNRGGEEF